MSSTGIKFYKSTYGTIAAAKTVATGGAIVFDEASHSIFVEGKQYGGNIADATFNNGVLTITKADANSTQLVLNFNSLASAESVMHAFQELHTEIDGIESAIGNVDGSDAGWQGYSGTEYIDGATSLSNADTLLDAAIASLAEDVSELQSGSVTDVKINNTSIIPGNSTIANIAVDGTYNDSTNKIATESTVSGAIENLDTNADVQPVVYTAADTTNGAKLTFKGVSETDGVIAQGSGATELQLAKVATSGTASDVTITDANNHFNTDTVQGAIDELYTTASGALQSVSHGTDTGSYVTLSVGTEDANHNQELYVSSTVQAMSTADSTHMGLAEASDVKSYVDTKVGTAIQSVDGSAVEKAKSVTQSNYAAVKVTATTDSSNNVTLDSAVALTTHAVSDAVASSADGLALASDVKSYVTTSIQGLDTTNDVAVASLSGTTLTLNGSIKEVDGVIDDGSASDVTLEFASAPTNGNKILTQAEIADLSGAMHFKSVITTSTGTGNDYVSLINSYYTTSTETPKVGDVFVDSTSGKEYVVKSLPASGTTLSNTNIEEFGSVDPTTQVTSLTSGTTTTGLTVTSNTNAVGAVTVNVNADSGYQIPTTTQMTKVDGIAVNETAKSVTDGTNTLSDLVSDSSYQHVSVSATDGVTAGGVTYKYTHPTATDTAAAAVKVGNDAQGHVVLGAALTGSDIAATSGTYGGSSSVTTVQGALDNLTSAISGAAITIDGHKGTITTGNGLTDVAADGGSFAVQIDSTNANGLSVGSNGVAMAKATGSTFGTVEVTAGNGLTLTDGVVAYAHNTTAITVASKDTSTNVITINGTLTPDASDAITTSNTITLAAVAATGAAANVSIIDSGNNFTATDVEGALAELAAKTATVVDAVGANSSDEVVIVNGGKTTIATVDGSAISTIVAFYWEEYA